jgi:glycosyltransferase involved in cell wall biosynthesis
VSPPQPPLELSVIVAARNAAATILAQLEALCTQKWDGEWEIVVADNASTDDTAELVEAFVTRCPRVHLVRAEERAGAGYARNCAMAASRGSAFAFCDADDIVCDGWVEAMGQALRQHECVGGHSLLDALNPSWLQTAFYRSAPDRLESFAGVFPFAATCNLGVRRTAIDHVGGFDETYLTGQDLELCLRLWVGGHRLVYVPEARIQYRYRPTMNSLWKRSRQYGEVAPAVAKRLEQLGAGRLPRRSGLKNYVWLARKLPSLRTKAGRARWLVVAGGKVGRLVGSIRNRYFYP